MAQNGWQEYKYYIEDHYLYMEMLNLMKGYSDMRRRKIKILYGSPAPPDGMPHGNKTGTPTEDKAMVLATIDERLDAIDEVMAEMRGKYSKTYTGEEFEPYEAFMDYGVFCYYRSKKGGRKRWRRQNIRCRTGCVRA